MIEEVKVKKIIAIVVAVLLLAGIALILINHLLYRFIFNSDRITGTIHVTIDGEEFDLKDDDIPGGTPEEKEAYMIMIKNLIQEQLDFEKAH